MARFKAKLLLGAAGRSLEAVDPPATTLQGKAVLMHATTERGHGESLVLLFTDGGATVQVVPTSHRQFDALRSGERIKVTGRWLNGGTDVAASSAAPGHSNTRLLVSSYRKLSGGAAAAGQEVTASAAGVRTASLGANGLITPEMSTLVIPIAGLTPTGQVCVKTDDTTVLSKAAVERVVFRGTANNGISLESTYNKCSYGKTQLNRQNSLVTDVVKLPCKGKTSGNVSYTFDTCSWETFNAWSDAALDALRAKGTNVDSYFYKVFLLPRGVCDFIGLGFIGCDGSYQCRAWVTGAQALVPQALVHELGHNLFLGHASTPQDEYGDDTGTMAACCSDRCFNTPHAYQLGWIKPLELSGATLLPGHTVQTTLASQAMTDKSGIRVRVSWVANAPPMYIGYRTAQRGDAAMPFANMVHVYTSPSTSTFDAQLSTWWSGLNAGQSFSQKGTGLVVRFLRANATTPEGFPAAVVSVCRNGGAETAASCAAGRDQDCNGLAGDRDPACLRIKANSKPGGVSAPAGAGGLKRPPPMIRRAPRRRVQTPKRRPAKRPKSL